MKWCARQNWWFPYWIRLCGMIHGGPVYICYIPDSPIVYLRSSPVDSQFLPPSQGAVKHAELVKMAEKAFGGIKVLGG